MAKTLSKLEKQQVKLVSEFLSAVSELVFEMSTTVRKGYRDDVKDETRERNPEWYKHPTTLAEGDIKFYPVDKEGKAIGVMETGVDPVAKKDLAVGKIPMKEIYNDKKEKYIPNRSEVNGISYDAEADDIIIVIKGDTSETKGLNEEQIQKKKKDNAKAVRHVIQAAIAVLSPESNLAKSTDSKQTDEFVHISMNELILTLFKKVEPDILKQSAKGAPTVRDIMSGNHEMAESIKGITKEVRNLAKVFRKSRASLKTAKTLAKLSQEHNLEGRLKTGFVGAAGTVIGMLIGDIDLESAKVIGTSLGSIVSGASGYFVHRFNKINSGMSNRPSVASIQGIGRGVVTNEISVLLGRTIDFLSPDEPGDDILQRKTHTGFSKEGLDAARYFMTEALLTNARECLGK